MNVRYITIQIAVDGDQSVATIGEIARRACAAALDAGALEATPVFPHEAHARMTAPEAAGDIPTPAPGPPVPTTEAASC